MPFSTRPFSMHVVMICMALMTLSLSATVFAQTTGKDPAPSVPQSATGLAASPAMRIYDGSIVDCFTDVTGVNPLEAARTKNTQALNMDTKVFMRIQDCMTKKGVSANFENYFAGKNKEGLSAAQRTDLQAIQSGLDSGKVPVTTPAAAPAPVPQPVMPVPQAVAPPPAAIPVPAPPEPEKPKADPAEGGGSTKTPRPSRQYWVKPE